MFLSHKYGFLYIRTRRTGSSSLLNMFLPYYSKEHNDVHLLINPPKENPQEEFWSVQSMLDFKIIDKNILKNYFVFAFERDMITKTISHYYQSHPIYGCCFSCYLKRGTFPIDNYMYEIHHTNENVLKYKAKYENYNDEIKYLWKRLFCEEPPKTIPHINKTENKIINMNVLKKEDKFYNK
jgi:hypothetical protein